MSEPFWCPAIRMPCSEVTLLKARNKELEEALSHWKKKHEERIKELERELVNCAEDPNWTHPRSKDK